MQKPPKACTCRSDLLEDVARRFIFNLMGGVETEPIYVKLLAPVGSIGNEKSANGP